jgi:photosystem II stability/assembly factor-like uncharacterized protein
MKRITFFLCLIITCCLSQRGTAAQYDIVGSSEYGRMWDLLYDPFVENRVYAITLTNHIMVSEDKGNTWEVFYALPSGGRIQYLRLTANGTALSFAVLVNNTSPDNKLYVLDIGTRKMLKELRLPNADMGAWVLDYAIYPRDNNVMVISTSYMENLITPRGKVFYTTDGGTHWKLIYYTGDFSDVSGNNIAISPDNPQKIFLTRSFGLGDVEGGLLVTEDAGNHWTEKLPDVVLGPIAFHPENPNTMLMGTGLGFSSRPKNMYRSLDGGDTWEVLDITWNAGLLNSVQAIAYNPGNLNHIIVLGESELVLSRDGGDTWNSFLYDPYGDNVYEYYYGMSASFNPFNPEEVFIGCDYYPFFSTDGGETLTRKKNPMFSSTGGIVKYVPAADKGHLYYGVQNGYVHRNLTSGEDAPYKIEALNIVGIGDGMSFFVDEEIPGRVYVFAPSGWMGYGLSVSDDHGATTRASFPDNMYNNRCTALSVDPSNRDRVWAFFSGSSPMLQRIDFSQPSPTATAGTLPYEPPMGTEIASMGIHVFDDSPDHLLLAFIDELYETTDAGLSWTKITAGLESGLGFIYSLTQNPLNPQQLTMATYAGIYTSTDGGQHWTRIYTGVVHRVSHSPKVDGHLVAFVHTTQTTNFGIRYSTDGGHTWGKIGYENLAYIWSVSATPIFADNSQADIYIGSGDLGLIKYTLDMEAGTGLYEVLINGQPADILDGTIEYAAACGETELSLHLTALGSITVNGQPYQPFMTLPITGDQETIGIIIREGEVTVSYSLVVTKALGSAAKPLFVQRWGNTLAVINNPAHNGGYSFDGYRWYNHNVPMGETGRYIALNGQPAANYSAEVHHSGTQRWHKTCPNMVTETAAPVRLYPNPVMAGQPLNVQLPEGVHSVNIRVIDISGHSAQLHKNVSTTLAAPTQPGLYLLQIQLPDGSITIQKIIVE